MERNFDFIISKVNPDEEIYRGEMSYSQARKFMNDKASSVRPVTFEVFNPFAGRWEKYGNLFYCGDMLA